MSSIEILIPTYNRRVLLLQGLRRLVAQIESIPEPSRVRVSIADNNSDDGTWQELNEFAAAHPCLSLSLHRRARNIGLERNAVGLLESATGEWVMFLGDDDILPWNYLARVLELASDSANTTVIPGFTAVTEWGSTSVQRGDPTAGPQERVYRPSIISCASLSPYGHQLSGVAFRRAGTVEAYTRNPKFRNIYPFIFFVGFNALRGRSWYLPRFQVEVLVGTAKDWTYDSSGLLRDTLANYRALFPNSYLKRLVCEISLVFRQPGRLPIQVLRTPAALDELLRSRMPTGAFKSLLPAIYAWRIATVAWRRMRMCWR